MFSGLSDYFKKILPKRLFYRALLIVAIPVLVLILFGLGAIFVNNLIINLIRTGIGFKFNWLIKPASFSLAEPPLPYSL